MPIHNPDFRSKKNAIKKKMFCFLGMLLAMLIFVYAAMFVSTNTLMKYIETVFSGETFIESDDDPLWRYSLIDRYYPETKTVNYDI